jgi:hypothetical protein
VKNPCLHWNEGLFYGPDTGIRWRTPLGKSMSQPIIVGNRVFTVEEPHTLTCLDADTGRILWRRENDHLELFDPAKRERGRELMQQVQDQVYRQQAWGRSYRWLVFGDRPTYSR